jgi:hypothetical protein
MPYAPARSGDIMDKRSFRQFAEMAGDVMDEHGLPHMAGDVVGASRLCAAARVAR